MSFYLSLPTVAFSHATRKPVTMRRGYYRVDSHTSIHGERAAVCTITNADGDHAAPRSYVLPRSSMRVFKSSGVIERI